jgi:hypothetical protein
VEALVLLVKVSVVVMVYTTLMVPQEAEAVLAHKVAMLVLEMVFLTQEMVEQG